jgi:alpha-L-rhamnosidase
MKFIFNLAFLTLAVLLLTPFAAVQAAGLANLRCEFRVNPLGIDAARPRFSWVIESKDRGVLQTAYQVVVDGVWDSGKVLSDQSQNVEYGGKPLVSCTRYNWKVRVWDNSGKVSGWSKPAWWIMGLLKPEEWTARWISTEMDERVVPMSAALQPKPSDEPYVRREFDLATIPTSALATVNVMGFYCTFELWQTFTLRNLRPDALSA